MDDKDEINGAVTRSMTALDRNRDGSVDEMELSLYMRAMAPLISIDDTLMWVEHALQLPQRVIERFRVQGLTGHDLPELLVNEGALLESELGVSPAIKGRVMASIKTILTGTGLYPLGAVGAIAIAPAPTAEKPFNGCGTLHLSWRPAPDTRRGALPPHRAVLQRLTPSPTGRQRQDYIHGSASSWVTVFAGSDWSFIDQRLRPGLRVEYRLSYWNAIGRSDYVYFEGVPRGGVCHDVMSMSMAASDSYGNGQGKDAVQMSLRPEQMALKSEEISDDHHQRNNDSSGESREWYTMWWSAWTTLLMLDSIVKQLLFLAGPLLYFFRRTSQVAWLKERGFVLIDKLSILLGIGAASIRGTHRQPMTTQAAPVGGSGAAIAALAAGQSPVRQDTPHHLSPRLQRAMRDTHFVMRGGISPTNPKPFPGPDGPRSRRLWPQSKGNACHCGKSLVTFMSRVHECSHEDCRRQGRRNRFCGSGQCGLVVRHTGGCHPKAGCMCLQHRYDVSCGTCGETEVPLEHRHRCTYTIKRKQKGIFGNIGFLSPGASKNVQCGKVFCSVPYENDDAGDGEGDGSAHSRCGKVVRHGEHADDWWRCRECRCDEHRHL